VSAVFFYTILYRSEPGRAKKATPIVRVLKPPTKDDVEGQLTVIAWNTWWENTLFRKERGNAEPRWNSECRTGDI